MGPTLCIFYHKLEAIILLYLVLHYIYPFCNNAKHCVVALKFKEGHFVEIGLKIHKFYIKHY
jgi:hypothetical protein